MRTIKLTPEQLAEVQQVWEEDGEDGGAMFGQVFLSETLNEIRVSVFTRMEAEALKALINKFRSNRRIIRPEDFDTRVFETFAELHPHEAYELDPEKMIAYAQKRNPALSVDDIKRLLAETEGGGE